VLGLKFQSLTDGYITGIYFYKGPENMGTHLGSLWTSTGTLLGSVTFVNETSSGWQYQALTNPVPIGSNTTYVVSYYAPVGKYSADAGYFTSSGVTNYPLVARSTTDAGGNGVYAYGGSGVFPGSSFNADNYWVDVSFEKPVLAVTANPQTKVYGQPDPPLTYSTRGFLPGDNAANVLTGSLARSAGEAVAGSPYAITQGILAANGKYTIAFTGNTLNITPATLTVTADPQSKVYGATNPVFTASYSGYVNGDTGSVLSGAPSLTSAATAASPVGAYTISAALGSLSATNYGFSFVDGTLTISEANSDTALTSSLNPSLYGSNVAFTVTVTPIGPATTTPTGSVQFYTNGIALGAPVALSGGVGGLNPAELAVGTNIVGAAYLGDGNYLGSSNSLMQVVSANVQTPTTVGIRNNGDGSVTVSFSGTPGAQYLVQARNDLAPATAWDNVSTNFARTNGQWTFTDSTADHPIRLYRAMAP
jgi:hypothetical protein